METEREVTWAVMNEGEDWLWRPVAEGLCLYESIVNGTLDLCDIAKMNEILDVKYENEKRYRKAHEEK